MIQAQLFASWQVVLKFSRHWLIFGHNGDQWVAISSPVLCDWLLSWEQILSRSKWKVSYRKFLIPALEVFPCFSIERTWYSFANSWRKWKKVPNSFISQQSIYPFIIQCNIIVLRQHKYQQVAFCKIINEDDSLCVVHCCGILPQS